MGRSTSSSEEKRCHRKHKKCCKQGPQGPQGSQGPQGAQGVGAGISASGGDFLFSPYFFGQGFSAGQPLNAAFPTSSSFGSNSIFTAIVQSPIKVTVDTTYIVSLWITPAPYNSPPAIIPTLPVTIKADSFVGFASRVVGIPIPAGALISFEVKSESGIGGITRGMASITPA